jgi:hypothetical protein
LSKNNFNLRILYPGKLSFQIDGAIKVFHDTEKLKQYMTTIAKHSSRDSAHRK